MNLRETGAGVFLALSAIALGVLIGGVLALVTEFTIR